MHLFKFLFLCLNSFALDVIAITFPNIHMNHFILIFNISYCIAFLRSKTVYFRFQQYHILDIFSHVFILFSSTLHFFSFAIHCSCLVILRNTISYIWCLYSCYVCVACVCFPFQCNFSRCFYLKLSIHCLIRSCQRQRKHMQIFIILLGSMFPTWNVSMCHLCHLVAV